MSVLVHDTFQSMCKTISWYKLAKQLVRIYDLPCLFLLMIV